MVLASSTIIHIFFFKIWYASVLACGYRMQLCAATSGWWCSSTRDGLARRCICGVSWSIATAARRRAFISVAGVLDFNGNGNEDENDGIMPHSDDNGLQSTQDEVATVAVPTGSNRVFKAERVETPPGSLI